MMEAQKDVRGVLRGACSNCKNCRGYDGSSSGGKKCKCLCPPTKHTNLELPVCKKCGKNSPPDFDYCSPECRNEALRDKEIGVVDIPDLDYSSPQVEMRRCRSEACSSNVYWEYKTEFEYCSPMCRDRDMLEGNHRELRQEIERMEGVLLEQGRQLKVLESSVDPPQNRLSQNRLSQSSSKGTSTKSNLIEMDRLDKVKSKGASNPNVTTMERKNQAATSSATFDTNVKDRNDRATKGDGFPSSVKEKDRKDQVAKGGSKKVISFLKEKHSHHGIIVCNYPWQCESSNEMGFLITGIEYNPNLKPFKMMQNSKLRFFDIILCVNGNPIVEGNTSEKSPQEVLDSLLSDQSEVKLTISIQSYSLRTTQDIIAAAKHQRYTHLIAIVNSSNQDPPTLGIEIDENKVFSVQAESSASLCGLITGDTFSCSVTGYQDLRKATNSYKDTTMSLELIRDHFTKIRSDRLDIIVAIIR